NAQLLDATDAGLPNVGRGPVWGHRFGARGRNHPRKIISAAFSAIIIVGAAVLPEVIVGITDASTTRKDSTPRTRNCGSTTAYGALSSPIFAVPTGWKIVVPIFPAALINSRSDCRRAPGRYSTG